jgi:DNA-directed RNA polymerase specialized sigma24 family protein
MAKSRGVRILNPAPNGNCFTSRKRWSELFDDDREEMPALTCPGSTRIEEQRLRKIGLRRAMKQLPDAQQDAILYCDILGYTEAEAAVILNRNQSNVHRNLAAAHETLMADRII